MMLRLAADIELNLADGLLTVGAREVAFTPQQIALLECLARFRPHYVTTDRMITALYRCPDAEPQSVVSVLRTQVHEIRARLPRRVAIESRYSYGYRLLVDGR